MALTGRRWKTDLNTLDPRLLTLVVVCTPDMLHPGHVSVVQSQQMNVRKIVIHAELFQ